MRFICPSPFPYPSSMRFLMTSYSKTHFLDKPKEFDVSRTCVHEAQKKEENPRSRSLIRGYRLFEPLRHLGVVPLVELLELVRVLKLHVKSHTPGTCRLPVAVGALIPLHLDRHRSLLKNIEYNYPL